MLVESLKSALIGTPLETPLTRLRRNWVYWRHPVARPLIDQDRCFDDILRRILEKRSNCIDIGCHLGSVLSQMVKLAPFGQHFAFEPIPYKAEWLRKKFPGVKVFNICLSNTSGEVPFYYSLPASGNSSLQVEENKESEYRVFRVRCERLDDIVPPDQPVDLVKIDVEGAELEVFQGASRLLAQNKPYLIFECTVSRTSCFGRTPEAVYDFLCGECGYAIFMAKDWLEGGAPIGKKDFASASCYPPLSYNFFAVSRDKI